MEDAKKAGELENGSLKKICSRATEGQEVKDGGEFFKKAFKKDGPGKEGSDPSEEPAVDAVETPAEKEDANLQATSVM
ncbi:hypothetical protein HK097_008516 [Rhizophlyctis rosea]|uniref:Uncharacterized protein n=1 Tax=Rhizophlyctis rosea TaxID=64517 RepID=A0AAD5SCC6_9FUNG|nr:hypothetical protein HK097_008516 [Rhizophlyctis rosea]